MQHGVHQGRYAQPCRCAGPSADGASNQLWALDLIAMMLDGKLARAARPPLVCVLRPLLPVPNVPSCCGLLIGFRLLPLVIITVALECLPLQQHGMRANNICKQQTACAYCSPELDTDVSALWRCADLYLSSSDARLSPLCGEVRHGCASAQVPGQEAKLLAGYPAIPEKFL